MAPQILSVTLEPIKGLKIADASGFGIAGCQAYLAVRSCGGTDWHEQCAAYELAAASDGLLHLEAVFPNFSARVRFERLSDLRWKLSGSLAATGGEPCEIARFHYLDGHVLSPTSWLLSMRQFELPGGIIRPDEEVSSPSAVCRAGWSTVEWSRLNDPIHNQPDIAISGDTGILGSGWNDPGLFFGFTGPGSAFGEVGLRTSREVPSFFVAVLLDAIRMEPGETRNLEDVIFSFGDPQEEFRNWAAECHRAFGRGISPRPPIVGYCSWYQRWGNVQPSDIRRALETFAEFEAPPGGRTIQIDDGYQICMGDWRGRDAWAEALPSLADEIRSRGFIPGIWLAPTAVHESHPLFREHPDWFQRNRDGEFSISFPNWGGRTVFLEPDHPGAREWIVERLREVQAMGWEYFKLDFAYTVSSAREKYDPRKTTFESLRGQWQLFRDALGNDAIINACIGGVWRYSLGLVDLSRMGGDIGGDPLQLRRNLSEMLVRSHVNGLWFQSDPDVFFMRSEESKLTLEESRLLTETQGLLGLAFLTSDFADQWDEDARNVVRRYWNAQGPEVPRWHRLVLDRAGLPLAIAAWYGGGRYSIAVYNWADSFQTIEVALRSLCIPQPASYILETVQGEGARASLIGGRLVFESMPAGSMRVARLTATDRT